MKKGILVGAFMFATGIVSAQGLYVGVGAGYGFATPSEALGVETTNTSGSNTSTTIYGTYGAGVNAGLNLGYMFTEHFGADLGVSYLMGSEVMTSKSTNSIGENTTTSKTSQMRLAPSLVLSTGGDLALYGKLGLVLPVGGKTITEVRDNTNVGGSVEYDFESKGAFSLGYTGAIGVDFSLSDKLSIFGELNGVNLRIKQSSREMTKATVFGTDELSSKTKYETSVNYVDELNSSSNNAGYNSNFNTSEAKDELAGTVNYSAMFINVGVKIKL